jgi:prepilin-type N-terminal cleavage/methylation domain-containing protein
MKAKQFIQAVARTRRNGFTLAEVVISLAIAGIGIGGLVSGYVMAARRAEFAALSAAAQLSALDGMERTHAARWDTLAVPPVDELVASNFPDRAVLLSIPERGTNLTTATVRTTLAAATSYDSPLKLVRVECVWEFLDGRLFTNSLVTHRAPNQ